MFAPVKISCREESGKGFLAMTYRCRDAHGKTLRSGGRQSAPYKFSSKMMSRLTSAATDTIAVSATLISFWETAARRPSQINFKS
jgi:hypothetical protein